MKEIKAIIRHSALDNVLLRLEQLPNLPGLTISHVAGWGKARARGATDHIHEGAHRLAKKVKVEIVVPDELVGAVVSTIEREAHSGRAGDGKIFVIDVEEAVKIRTGDRGAVAL